MARAPHLFPTGLVALTLFGRLALGQTLAIGAQIQRWKRLANMLTLSHSSVLYPTMEMSAPSARVKTMGWGPQLMARGWGPLSSFALVRAPQDPRLMMGALVAAKMRMRRRVVVGAAWFGDTWLSRGKVGVLLLLSPGSFRMRMTESLFSAITSPALQECSAAHPRNFMPAFSSVLHARFQECNKAKPEQMLTRSEHA